MAGSVIIYSKNNCEWCTKAKKLAEDMNIDVDYRNVDDNIDFGFELMAAKPNAKTLPQIWWNNRYIGGYTEFAQEAENTIGTYGHGKI